MEDIRLRVHYTSRVRVIVNAARQFIGEGHDVEAQQGYAGTIDFHHRPAGLADQAAFICGTLIPAIQQRMARISLGEIAILYMSRNQGDVLEAAR